MRKEERFLINRRKFLQVMGIGIGVAALPARKLLADDLPGLGEGQTYGVLVDTRRCVDCKACQIGCKVWNENEPDPTTFKTDFTPQTYTYVQEHEAGAFDEVAPTVVFTTAKRQCMHCEEPACVAACPQGGDAIHKEANGAVVINHDNCIKCQLCVNNCPYGVPKFDADASQIRKCVFCYDRLEMGVKPACVSTCPADALIVDTRENIVALAEEAVSAGAAVYGNEAGAGTSWLYVFAPGTDPDAIING